MASAEEEDNSKYPLENILSHQDGVEYELQSQNRKSMVKDVDSAWSWVVLCSSFTSLFMEGISMGIVGLMHLHLLEAFQQDEAATSWAGSLLLGIQCVLAPVASWVTDRWGCRTCVILGGLLSAGSLAISSLSSSLWMSIVTYGILNSFGMAIYLTPSLVINGFYFKRHARFASAICVLGANFGLMLAPVIFSTLEQTYGWRGAVLIISGLILNVCVCGALQRPSVLERQKLKSQNYRCWPTCWSAKDKTRLSFALSKNSVLRKRRFIFLVLGFSFSNFAMSIIYLHVPKYVVVLNGSIADIQTILLAMGLAGVLAKLLVGLGSGLDKLCLLIGSYTIAGIALMVLPSVAHSQLGRSVCLFIATFYYSVEPTMYVPLLLDIVGLKKLVKAIGIAFCLMGMLFTLGPVLAASLLEYTGDYTYSIYLAGASFVLSSISCIMVGLSSKESCDHSDEKSAMNKSSEIT